MLPTNIYLISKYSLLRGLSKIIVALALAFMLISITACGRGKTDKEVTTSEESSKSETVVEEASGNEIYAEIQANKEKWLSHEINGYQLEIQKLCFCAPDAVRLMIFDIEKDEIKTVRYADTGDLVDPSFYNQYNTIEGLFALVEQALAKNPADLTIAYNDEYGYIKELTIDYKENIADDEVTIIASNMKPTQ